jgi:hypothetical protein
MTPRSVKRTLRKLREEGAKRTITEMATALRIADETLEKWEGRREELTHALKVQDLQRYQDELGIPTGIILLISQVLAGARDGRVDHLEVLAGMMRALAARIATRKRRRQAVDDVQQGRGPDATTFRDWDNHLVILIGAVWGAVPSQLRETFRNPARIAVYDERRANNVAKAAKKSRSAPEPVAHTSARPGQTSRANRR